MLMLIYFLVNISLIKKNKQTSFLFNLDFENDLLDIRTTFESHKDDPPLPRNAPPVPGKILFKKSFFLKVKYVF